MIVLSIIENVLNTCTKSPPADPHEKPKQSKEEFGDETIERLAKECAEKGPVDYGEELVHSCK